MAVHPDVVRLLPHLVVLPLLRSRSGINVLAGRGGKGALEVLDPHHIIPVAVEGKIALDGGPPLPLPRLDGLADDAVTDLRRTELFLLPLPFDGDMRCLAAHILSGAVANVAFGAESVAVGGGVGSHDCRLFVCAYPSPEKSISIFFTTCKQK